MNNRSHSISVVNTNGSSADCPQQNIKDKNNKEPAAEIELSELKTSQHPSSPQQVVKGSIKDTVVELPEAKKTLTLDCSSSSSSGASSVSSEQDSQVEEQMLHPDDLLNLKRNQITRDKTEGLNHLDQLASQMLQHAHNDLFTSNKSNHHHPSPQPSLHHFHHPLPQPHAATIVHQPSSLVHSNSGHFSTHNSSYYDLKQLGSKGSGGEGTPIMNKKKLAFIDTPHPVMASSSRSSSLDPNLDPIDGIVSLLSAIYCKILVVIGE